MKTLLILFLSFTTLNAYSQSFELVDQVVFDHSSKDPVELKIPIDDFFIEGWDCAGQEDDTIVIGSLETFEGFNVWLLESPGLKNIDRVVMVELEWLGCCSYIESHYFLISEECTYTKLDMIKNEACDFPEDRVEYLFPSQDFGRSHSIRKALTTYSIDGKIIESHTKDIINWIAIPASKKAEYNFDDLSLVTGTLELKNYLGPPGFGEDPEKDKKYQCWVLYLDQPISVYENDPNEGINRTVENIDLIQLNKQKLNLNAYEGIRLSLRGVFYSPHTGYHQEELLMDVEKVIVIE